jgi:hypothetical protein
MFYIMKYNLPMWDGWSRSLLQRHPPRRRVRHRQGVLGDECSFENGDATSTENGGIRRADSLKSGRSIRLKAPELAYDFAGLAHGLRSRSEMR